MYTQKHSNVHTEALSTQECPHTSREAKNLYLLASAHPYMHTHTCTQTHTCVYTHIILKKAIHKGTEKFMVRYVCAYRIISLETIMSHPLYHTFGHIISLRVFEVRDDVLIEIYQ